MKGTFSRTSHLKSQTNGGFDELYRKASAAGQKHIFRWWNQLDDAQRSRFIKQVRSIDFDVLSHLVATRLRKAERKFAGDLQPADVIPVPATAGALAERQHMADMGEVVIRQGKVCLFIVAGGQGSRLNYDPPKGTFPICPITGKSLFHVFAEKLLAANRRYGVTIPLYVMTSEVNNNATQEFFRVNQFFGLDSNDVMFVVQDMLPCVTPDGKIILAKKDEIAVNPNGHGGAIKALKDGGALDNMRNRGIRYISYHQVDNVLAKSIDPVFIGYHVDAKAEMSLKVVRKRDAEEKIGIVGKLRERVVLVEYSDLSPELMCATNSDGSLRHAMGSIAVHILNVDFIERENEHGFCLPFHSASKAVPYVDDHGETVVPDEPNAIKFETFVFDALADARRPVVMEVRREDEFIPLKNTAGTDSPESARRAYINACGRWLQKAGVDVPTDNNGDVRCVIEISPLFALDEDELAAKVDRNIKLDGRLLLEEDRPSQATNRGQRSRAIPKRA